MPKHPILLESVLIQVGMGSEGENDEFRLQAVSHSRTDASVWISGTGGVYGVAESSAGTDWVTRRFEDSELQFRDVQALSGDRAVLLAAGTGNASRLYTTDDGGETLALRWQGPKTQSPLAEEDGGSAEGVFLDCMDFWDSSRGLVYGDSIDGKLFVLLTQDGGASWKRSITLPPARAGEGGFAASGDCLRVAEGGWVGIVTGASEQPRLLKSLDFGATWTSRDLPLPGGASGGGFALAVSYREPDQHRLFVAGGDLEQMDKPEANVIVSEDGGITWEALAGLPFPGPVYGLAVDYSAGIGREVLVVVGPGGVARSLDGGATFEAWTEAEHWSVAFSGPGRGLMVGPKGRVTRFAMTAEAPHPTP